MNDEDSKNDLKIDNKDNKENNGKDFKLNSKKKSNFPSNKKNNFSIYFLIGSIIIFLIIQIFFNKSVKNEMTYSDFLEYLESNSIASVKIVNNSYIEAILNVNKSEKKEYKILIPYNDSQLIQTLKDKKVPFKGVEKTSFLPILIANLPFVFFVFFLLFLFRQMRNSSTGMNITKNKAKKFLEGQSNIKFDDVAGQEEAKYELKEIVDFLKNPQKYKKIGARIPKGVLLSGKPGTGKTLLARAVAGESKVNFFHISGSDFIELFVGVGAGRVRDLFSEARKNEPSIIFIDELDAIGRQRSNGFSGSHEEKEQTLNQILVEMDGFETYENVIVIGATNRIDILDSALIRPGRFDRQINISSPDILEREQILNIHIKNIQVDENLLLKEIAQLTTGFVGADLANLANESALIATRKEKEKVDIKDFNEAFDKIVMGISRKSNLLAMSDEDKLKTAYHEAGHALVNYLIEDHPSKINKVTILPRGQALGYAMHVPKSESAVYTMDSSSILNSICSAYGGYAAEKIIYKKTTSGVAADLKYAREYAERYVCEYGMSDLGGVYLSESEAKDFGDSIKQKYSNLTLEKIDNEISKILTSCLNKTISLLENSVEKLHTLAKELVKKETLLDSEIKELLGF